MTGQSRGEQSMLRDDLKTVRGILAKKREVSANLHETAAWCQPGRWYVEGPYARHKDVELPEGLRDSIRGIRTRRASRELVERAAPPWLVTVPDHDSRAAAQSNCSIAYLSSGGNWKLFDFDNQVIWTRLRHVGNLDRDKANHERYATYFNIPAWHIVELDDGIWRSETYLADANLVHSDEKVRADSLKVLFQQYAVFARREAAPANPALTRAAIRAIVQTAPESIPARAAQRYAPDMERLGAKVGLLPAHGDLSGQNVFVCGGQPWIIDWDTAGQDQPMFYDPLYLILREAELGRPDLLRAFLDGKFDQELDRMFALCGLPPRSCDNLILLMHSYVVHFHAIRTAERRDATRHNIESLWNRLQPFCAGYV
jgi:hypothetical protein